MQISPVCFRLFASIALIFFGISAFSQTDAFAVATWTCTHGCTAGPGGFGGMAAASRDQRSLYPNSTLGGECSYSGGIATCYSYGNNAFCDQHPTDQFKCGGGATRTCTTGTDFGIDGGCIAVAEQRSKTCPVWNGDPVDTLTGTSVQEATDWASSGVDPLKFTRSYASSFGLLKAPTYSRLGNAWRSNFDAAASWMGSLGSPVALPTSATTIHIVLPDSIEYSFKQQTGVWKPVIPRPHPTSTASIYWDQFRTDIDLKLTITASTVEMVTPEGTRYIFGFDGLLKQITFVDGYAQYLEYSGILNTRVTDSFGRWLEFAYDTPASLPSLLSKVITSDGKTIDFTYENRAIGLPSGFYNPSIYALKSVVYPDATPAVSTDNPTLTYEYLNDAEQPFLMTGVVDERGIRHVTWTFDSNGRVLTNERAGGMAHFTFAYDDVNNKVTVTNPLGRQTVYSYQRIQGQIRRLTAVDGISTVNCAASNTVYAYDTNGFRSQATDAKSRITKWTRNSRGLPTSRIEGFGTPEARTTTTSWDATRPLPTSIAGPGLTTSMSYNTAGRMTSLTLTDTTTTTVPYSTNGQTRTTAFNYSTIALPAPPAVGPTGAALADVPLTVVNGTASSGTADWTNTTGAIAARTTAPCTTSMTLTGT